MTSQQDPEMAGIPDGDNPVLSTPPETANQDNGRPRNLLRHRLSPRVATRLMVWGLVWTTLATMVSLIFFLNEVGSPLSLISQTASVISVVATLLGVLASDLQTKLIIGITKGAADEVTTAIGGAKEEVLNAVGGVEGAVINTIESRLRDAKEEFVNAHSRFQILATASTIHSAIALIDESLTTLKDAVSVSSDSSIGKNVLSNIVDKLRACVERCRDLQQ